MKKVTRIYILLLFPLYLFSQVQKKDTVTRKATITYTQKGNYFSFKSVTPPLIPIAGAPAPNYSYFWEFGDGSYSKKPEPKKKYQQTKSYQVRLNVTNNYDNGKPPKTRPKTVAAVAPLENNPEEPGEEIASLESKDYFQLFPDRDPIPEEEIILVLGYQNPLDYVANGRLYLFYNDKAFKHKNFELLETRSHFGEHNLPETKTVVSHEKNTSSLNVASTENTPTLSSLETIDEEDLEKTLADSKLEFSDLSVWEFENMNPKESRNLFFTFKTTPEMIKDTSATVKMRGIYVPDRNFKTHKKRNLEMEIVTSHDPNKMSSNGFLLDYRKVQNKKIDFKTRFQNNGEGPARTIRLETDIPDMFDKSTLEILDMYPKCPICPKNEVVTYSCLDTIIKQKQIHFTFKNIYLPGSQQKNVMEKDSTKGFVKYALRFGKEFHKEKTQSKTAIFFDKNEPVITNYATTRFLPGKSFGIKAGYNYFPKLINSRSNFLSATLSPYKSFHWHWQVELQQNFHQYETGKTFSEVFVTSKPGAIQLQQTTNYSSFENYRIDIPVLARYSINNYFGVGCGALLHFNGIQKESMYTEEKLYENTSPTTLLKTTQTMTQNQQEFSGWGSGFLLDATVGFSRIGPSVGARYILETKKEFSYWQFYAIWKF